MGKVSNLDIKFLAQKFPKLKSFGLVVDDAKYHKVLSQIFEFFNQLESITVHATSYNVQKSFDDEFYLTKHPNMNLKSLNIPKDLSDVEKLLTKIKNDFPNLEEFSRISLNEAANRLEEILFNDINRQTCLVDMRDVKNGNDIFKDRSCEFYKDNKVKVINDGNKHIALNIKSVRTFLFLFF